MQNKILANGNLPRHIAIIMDGNGRWAKKRLQPRMMGHRAGRKAVKRTVEAAAELGVECLTLYTFSTENWKRPSDEVAALLSFLAEVLESEFLRLAENNIRLISMGRLHNLPEPVRRILEQTQKKLAGNTGMILNLALSYSGHCELVDAARAFAEQVQAGKAQLDDLDEESFVQYLYRPELPPVDLLIRTSGEQRISNFCLWQLAYSEIHNSAKFWPDFKAEDLHQAILDYQGRERRFGKVR